MGVGPYFFNASIWAALPYPLFSSFTTLAPNRVAICTLLSVLPLSIIKTSPKILFFSKYFCAFFKQMTDQSPFEYLTNYRIERAARKLINTDLSVTAIAFECGFNSSNYFTTVFKKHTGTTPLKFRRQGNGG